MSSRFHSLSLVALLFVSCASRASREPAASIALEQVVRSAQAQTGANYTFDQATAQELNATFVSPPAARVDAATLESVLREAGFRIRPVGPAELRTFVIEPAGK